MSLKDGCNQTSFRFLYMTGFKRPGETDMDYFERRYQERLRAERGGGGGGGPNRRAIQQRAPPSSDDAAQTGGRAGRGGRWLGSANVTVRKLNISSTLGRNVMKSMRPSVPSTARRTGLFYDEMIYFSVQAYQLWERGVEFRISAHRPVEPFLSPPNMFHFSYDLNIAKVASCD